MIERDARIRPLAWGLAMLAGCVDAIAFIMLGGYFVSFMSGNSTRLAADLVVGEGTALIAATALLSFVGGVVAGSLIGRRVQRRHQMVLLTVTGLLVCAAVLATSGRMLGACAFMAAAMGAENATFERDGEISFGLTYMTGALVKTGQRIAAALSGGPRWAWMWPLSLWLALASGAVAGAMLFVWLGPSSLWIVAGGAALAAVAAGRLDQAAIA